MQNLVRLFACAYFLGSSIAIAQELAGAKADPSEIPIGNTVEIAIDFRTNQGPDGNSSWRCGLNISYGNGKSEFHRIDSKQMPYKVIHKYEAPGNYAVTLEGKLQFQGFNTVFPCSGQSQSVAIVVRPENFAARQAEERAAQEEALKRAAADREAAQRAAEQAQEERASAERAAQKASQDRAAAQRSAEQAKVDRASADRAKQKAALDRATAEKQRDTAPQAAQKAAPKSTERASSEKAGQDVKATKPPPIRVQSPLDL